MIDGLQWQHHFSRFRLALGFRNRTGVYLEKTCGVAGLWHKKKERRSQRNNLDRSKVALTLHNSNDNQVGRSIAKWVRIAKSLRMFLSPGHISVVCRVPLDIESAT